MKQFESLIKHFLKKEKDQPQIPLDDALNEFLLLLNALLLVPDLVSLVIGYFGKESFISLMPTSQYLNNVFLFKVSGAANEALQKTLPYLSCSPTGIVLQHLVRRQLKAVKEILDKEDKASVHRILSQKAWVIDDTPKNRRFYLTPLQLSWHYLDSRAWKMFIGYLDDNDNEINDQLREFEKLETPYGKHNTWKEYREGLKAAIKHDDHPNRNEDLWVEEVGGGLLDAPMHVIHQVLHPTRPLYPVPAFDEKEDLPESLSYLDVITWQTLQLSLPITSSGLGVKFALIRADGVGRAVFRGPGKIGGDVAKKDFAAMTKLLEVERSRYKKLVAHRLNSVPTKVRSI